MELELEHALTGQRLPVKIPATEVVNAIRINAGDHVIHGNWVGYVEEVFEEALVETDGSQDLVRVCDIGHSLSVGAVPNDVSGLFSSSADALAYAHLRHSSPREIASGCQSSIGNRNTAKGSSTSGRFSSASIGWPSTRS